MAGPARQGRESEERRIGCYVDLATDRYPSGRGGARLRESGVSIWAIVAFLRVYDNDVEKVAGHFGLSREEVEAAVAYYRRNKAYVDARIALNEA